MHGPVDIFRRITGDLLVEPGNAVTERQQLRRKRHENFDAAIAGAEDAIHCSRLSPNSRRHEQQEHAGDSNLKRQPAPEGSCHVSTRHANRRPCGEVERDHCIDRISDRLGDVFVDGAAIEGRLAA